MNTKQYIINDIKPFNDTANILEVQNVFNLLTYSHIPVTRDDVYLGSISENDAHSFDGTKQLSDYLYSLESFFVRENTNWLDILEAFPLNNSNIMPVLSEENNYLGYYELNDIMALFNNTPFLNEAGGIIVVEKALSDNSFSEISQIIESNDANILGFFISKMDNNIVQTTIKIGHTGMNAIVQTFRRYGYYVISNHEEDTFIEDLKDRSNYLDKYLNI